MPSPESSSVIQMAGEPGQFHEMLSGFTDEQLINVAKSLNLIAAGALLLIFGTVYVEGLLALLLGTLAALGFIVSIGGSGALANEQRFRTAQAQLREALVQRALEEQGHYEEAEQAVLEAEQRRGRIQS